MKRLLSLIIASFLCLAAMAQEDTIKPVHNPIPAYSFEKYLSVGNTDKKGNATSAWFEVGDTSTTKAMILPRVQDTSVILYPKPGMIVYSKVDSSVYYRVRTRWMNVNTGGAGASYINGYGLVLTGNVFALNIALRDSILAAARDRGTHTGIQPQSTIVGLVDTFQLYAKKTFTDSNYTNKNRYVASQFRGKALGDRYNKTGFISGDLSSFTASGITAAVSNGKIVLSSSTGSASSGIYLTNTYSAADRWQMKVGFKPGVKNGSSGYLAAGCFSQNTTFPINLAGLIGQNTSLDGTIRILDGASLENTRVTGSSLVFSVGDSIELTLIRNGYILSVRALNVTTNTSEVYSQYLYGSNESMANSFRPGIMATGGIDSIYHFSFSVLEPYMNRIAIVGDSKTTFYGMNNAESLASLFSAGLDDVAMFGKGGEKTAELVNVVNSEIVAAAPEQVLICIGSNDSRYSVARATTYANIDKITDTLDKYGIKYQFFLMKENPAALYDADQFYLDSFFKVTYPNNYISETYSVTENSPNCYNADGIHLNAYGNLLVYNSIMTSGKIHYPVTFKDDPVKTFRLNKSLAGFTETMVIRNTNSTGYSGITFETSGGLSQAGIGIANASSPLNPYLTYFNTNGAPLTLMYNAVPQYYIDNAINIGYGNNHITPTRKHDFLGAVRFRTFTSITDTGSYKPIVMDANGNMERSTYWYGSGAPGGGGVTSFNGRTGAVTPQAGDYNTVTETLSNKSMDGANNTFTNIPQSAVTNLVANLAAKLSGTLSPGYILKGSSAAVATNSQLYDDGNDVRIGSLTPDTKSAFSVHSTTKGTRPFTEMTTAQRLAMAPGSTSKVWVWDTDLQKLFHWDGTQWQGYSNDSEFGNVFIDTKYRPGASASGQDITIKSDTITGSNGVTVTYVGTDTSNRYDVSLSNVATGNVLANFSGSSAPPVPISAASLTNQLQQSGPGQSGTITAQDWKNLFYTTARGNPTGTVTHNYTDGFKEYWTLTGTGGRTLAFSGLGTFGDGYQCLFFFDNTSGGTITLTLPSNCFVKNSSGVYASGASVTIPTGKSNMSLDFSINGGSPQYWLTTSF
ncbi:MAG: hypothetical protein J0M30_14845 [Chitinophagales bacterium]|nr:hypothetical protein [Chitinophagales bacterium]